MRQRRFIYRLGLVGILTLSGALLGCMGGQGSTDGGSSSRNSYDDDTFVADESNTGSVSLDVSSTDIEVGNTSGFVVRAINSRQQGVAGINVVCDSEDGIAILEPQKGYAPTDSSGNMSGVIGCEAPGSFQFVCRLALGANRRSSVAIKCSGDVPSGFQGFPGAAGGGLGGGSQTNDDGDVRIISAAFSDAGTSTETSASIDISQISDCDGDLKTIDVEPFYDTYVKLVAKNNRPEQVRFEYLQYSVADVDAKGTEFTSKKLGLTEEADSTVVQSGQTATITMPVFKAYSGGKYVGDPLGTGIRISNRALLTVTFALVGKTASGESVAISAKATGSFGDFNRCS
jgi:hypothetical protein